MSNAYAFPTGVEDDALATVNQILDDAHAVLSEAELAGLLLIVRRSVDPGPGESPSDAPLPEALRSAAVRRYLNLLTPGIVVITEGLALGGREVLAHLLSDVAVRPRGAVVAI